MEDQAQAGSLFRRLREYFQTSDFRFLELEHYGTSMRFSREDAGGAGGSIRSARALSTKALDTATERIAATSIGYVGAPPGKDGFPALGKIVAQGSVLFVLRRFSDVIEIHATRAGKLNCIMVMEGDLVEFGQPLASIG